ncbi:unnamed protein product [Ambrosiozyma monospora]|uniref:Unnamed protein product n=1 Tax=Ambrosiozyma monospora TaxID=43982 RepID=A0ACB5SV61_AMBMO|nr:unnamed protein product [Ambrosiozyma monospora]
MAPETEILPYVQYQHTGEPLTTTTTFNSNSKKFYAAQWESHIIITSESTNEDKDMWKDYWSRFTPSKPPQTTPPQTNCSIPFTEPDLSNSNNDSIETMSATNHSEFSSIDSLSDDEKKIHLLCGRSKSQKNNNLAYMNDVMFDALLDSGSWTSRNGDHIFAVNLVTEKREEPFYTSFEVPYDKQDSQHLKDQLAKLLDGVNRQTKEKFESKDGRLKFRTKLVAICTAGACVMTSMKKLL